MTTKKENTQFHFGTKAETLSQLKKLLRKSKILDLIHFTVEDWNSEPDKIITLIRKHLNNNKLVVRSSAQGEDGLISSMAGAYHSCLNVDNDENVKKSIQEVINSYQDNIHDQILVQPMLNNIELSGVVMTNDMENGSPYYVINYDDESGQTDTITGGKGVHKTVLIYRDYNIKHVQSERLRKILTAVHEIESQCNNVPLDIEFALTKKGEVYVFQVRQISLYKQWHPVTEKRVSRKIEFVEEFVEQRSLPRKDVLGKKTILGVMPDWNPAEIVGTRPRPLAVSLYRELVTNKVWRESRRKMGYRRLPAEELMVVIDNHPYIDVRNSFNSFLPEGLSDETGELLVNAWLNRLETMPELHDKVEFSVAQTCIDFSFKEDYSHRYAGLLTDEQMNEFHRSLVNLSNRNISLKDDASLAVSLKHIDELASHQKNRPIEALEGNNNIVIAEQLIDECKRLGTMPFSILARHGFMAESLLRSLVRKKAISEQRYSEFKKSIHTITSDLATEYQDVCTGNKEIDSFLEKFGHLRPGTYEITSLRYDERADLFSQSILKSEDKPHIKFRLSKQEKDTVSSLLTEIELDISADDLMLYAEKAIAGREYAKFVFTRNLSDALVYITRWGEQVGLSRDDLSFIDWPSIYNILYQPCLDYDDRYFIDKADAARKSLNASIPLKMSHVIRNTKDLFIVPVHRSMPNFITNKQVEADLVHMTSNTPASITLQNRIICIENADPGFDWVFTRGIGGLITKFGGANSHMAIRCAEFGIPAAIGCGEQTYKRVTSSTRAILDCDNKVVTPLGY